jgi:hypothetical protein
MVKPSLVDVTYVAIVAAVGLDGVRITTGWIKDSS